MGRHKVLNKATGLMVFKTGRIGRQIMEKKKDKRDKKKDKKKEKGTQLDLEKNKKRKTNAAACITLNDWKLCVAMIARG